MATKKKLTAKTILEPGNYPIVDGDRKYYAVTPVKRKKGWAAVEIIIENKGGFINPDENPGKRFLKTKEECQKGCDIHNSWLGISKKCVEALIDKSMELQTMFHQEAPTEG